MVMVGDDWLASNKGLGLNQRTIIAMSCSGTVVTTCVRYKQVAVYTAHKLHIYIKKTGACGTPGCLAVHDEREENIFCPKTNGKNFICRARFRRQRSIAEMATLTC